MFITHVNLQEVADPNPDPNPNPNPPCNYIEAYRSLWVGYAWTTESLFFTLAARSSPWYVVSGVLSQRISFICHWNTHTYLSESPSLPS